MKLFRFVFLKIMKPTPFARHDDCRPDRIPFLLALFLALAIVPFSQAGGPIRVVVWDEQQPQQRAAYSNFLGNEIAAFLNQQPGLEVTSRRLNDPEQGLGPALLDACDVLIFYETNCG